MSDTNGTEDEVNINGKKLLRDLGKRATGYLKLSQTVDGGWKITDDVGCPINGVRNFKIHTESGAYPAQTILTLEVIVSGAEIVTG